MDLIHSPSAARGPWAAITAPSGLVPFLAGYLAVAALTLRLAMAGAPPATASFALGSLVLFLGDKLVRPAMAHNGAHTALRLDHLGCLGGFEVLGLVVLVVGPVAPHPRY